MVKVLNQEGQYCIALLRERERRGLSEVQYEYTKCYVVGSGL